MPLRSAIGWACCDRVLDHGAQVVRPQVQRHEARIELRELQQVGGQPVEAFDLASALLEELVARIWVLGGTVAQQLVEGAQRGDGRAQLVRDIGQELPAAVAVLR